MSIPEKSIRIPRKNVLHPLDMVVENPESREDCVRKSLKVRLNGVCAHLSRAEFEVLVSKMTHEQLRGEGILGGRIRPC